MLRSLLLTTVVLHTSTIVAGENVQSWLKLERKGQVVGFISTAIAQDKKTIQVAHTIMVGVRDNFVSASTSVNYERSDGKLSTTNAKFVMKKATDKKPNQLLSLPTENSTNYITSPEHLMVRT